MMCHDLLNERNEKNIGRDSQLPKQLEDILEIPYFWSAITKIVTVLDPISACLGFLEAHTRPLSNF